MDIIMSDPQHMQALQQIMSNSKLSESQKHQKVQMLCMKVMKNGNKSDASKSEKAPVEEESKGESSGFEQIKMSESDTGLNGSLAEASWAQPKASVKSKEVQRSDHGFGFSGITKTEYQDGKDLLNAKINLMAKKIKNAKSVVIYCGAGISTSSGINDIASKNKKQESGNRL